MAKQFESLLDEHIDFIKAQKIFFVSTAMPEGRINLSPKGMDTFRVIDNKTVCWLNLTGSGNETAAHIAVSPRMTIMMCAFEGKPLILRMYGAASVLHPYDEGFEKAALMFPEIAGTRQIFTLDISLVHTSCGFAVPYMDFVEERPILKEWAEKQGPEKIRNYWEEKNQFSLDGAPSHILAKSE